MNIANNRVVSIHYTLTNDAGEVLDSSEGREPLNYLHGAGNIIPGLENALLDKVAGDELNVTVEPADGYGVRRDELIQKVPREAFQGVDQVEVDMAFHAETQNGMQTVEVIEVDEDTVTIDGNHPLAGQTLNFEIEVVGIREATPEELQHGHVHSAEGCGHEH